MPTTNYEWLVKAVKSHKSDECLLWPFGKDQNGYGQISLNYRNYRAHRIAFQLAHGRLPTGVIMHTCDVSSCVNPRHLKNGTHADNRRDCVKKNRMAKGVLHGKAKLTPEIVRQIRNEIIYRHPEHGCAALSRRYGVDVSTIQYIVKGKFWRHLIEPLRENAHQL